MSKIREFWANWRKFEKLESDCGKFAKICNEEISNIRQRCCGNCRNLKIRETWKFQGNSRKFDKLSKI